MGVIRPRMRDAFPHAEVHRGLRDSKCVDGLAIAAPHAIFPENRVTARADVFLSGRQERL